MSQDNSTFLGAPFFPLSLSSLAVVPGEPPCIATGGTDWAVRIWDVVTCRESARLMQGGHTYCVNFVAAASFEGVHCLISGGDDRRVVVWDARMGDAVASMEKHVSAVTCVALDQSGQGKWLASGGEDGYLYIYEPRTWKVLKTLHSPPHAASSSLTGHGASRPARRWEGETEGASMLHRVTALTTSPCGSMLFGAGGKHNRIRAWEAGSWEERGSGFEVAGLSTVNSLCTVEMQM
ncbi:unnamed protein product [Chrysoparadoxa australica]